MVDMADLMEEQMWMMRDEEDEYLRKTESRWSRGWHQMKNGRKIKIKDMDNNHLKNTINLFSPIMDTSTLEKELAQRQNITK